MTARLVALVALLALLLGELLGCTAAPSLRGSDGGGGPPPDVDGGVTPPSMTPTPPPPPPSGCGSAPGLDQDADGFPNGVDCNDCAAQINPGAFDEPDNGIDEDCDGGDAVVSACDGALSMAPGTAEDAARAIGLCRMATGPTDWGVVSARFTTADGAGSPVSMSQAGILPSFGAANRPSEGASMLALSSGVARAPDQPGYSSQCDLFEDRAPSSRFPPTFPQESRSCPGVSSGQVFDSIALEVTIRVPTNARGFSFRSSFFTYEYPVFICDEFNDFFAVLRQDDGGEWRNIVFDEDGNAVSVNNSLLRACAPGMAGGKRFDCPLGRASLVGTGFGADSECGYDGSPEDPWDPWGDPEPSTTDGQEVGAGTGWLRTVAPVTPGELLTLRFMIWDSGDGDLDSTALVDAFEWELEPVDVTETVPDLI